MYLPLLLIMRSESWLKGQDRGYKQLKWVSSTGWLSTSLGVRVRSSVTREKLGVEPLLLLIRRTQLRLPGHLFRMPPRHVLLRGDSREDWRRAGGTICLTTSLGTPQDPPDGLEMVSVNWVSGHLFLDCLLRHLIPENMDGWPMLALVYISNGNAINVIFITCNSFVKPIPLLLWYRTILRHYLDSIGKSGVGSYRHTKIRNENSTLFPKDSSRRQQNESIYKQKVISGISS